MNVNLLFFFAGLISGSVAVSSAFLFLKLLTIV